MRAELWTTWANRAIDRWTTFDAEWGRQMKVRLFFNTGDFIFRPAPEVFTERTQELWKQLAYSVRDSEGRGRRARVSSVRSDEDRVCVVRPESRSRARASRVRSGGRGVSPVWRRGADGSCRARRSRRRAPAEHPNDRPCRYTDRRHVRARARPVVSQSVSGAHGRAHPDTARPRALFRHAAGRRSLHVPEYSELEFSWQSQAGPRCRQTIAASACGFADRRRRIRTRATARSIAATTRSRAHFSRSAFRSYRRRRFSKRARATTR